ncbi:MAG: RluA family pseudouridine synthase [bacterium]|nr:RluA family pseudouridine synthase [bacterium]
MLKLKVNAGDKGKRADVFITEKLAGYTRSSLSALFDKELVLVNGKPAKASYKLRAGDKVEVNTSLLTAEPEAIEIPVIYQDDDVIVMNKPAGLLTHSKGALNTEATVASFINPLLTDNSLTDNRAGIVHRLDRATSGVIIAAKNATTLKLLQKQFSTRKVKKTYIAVVEGIPKPEEAIIDAPIARNPKKPQTFRVDSAGKPAQTQYKTLKNFTKGRKHYSLLELRPQTGRTHQLRVHLKYIGHPIIGDQVYGHAKDNMYLYAKSLEITVPGGHRKIFEVAEPKTFKDFM